MPDIKSVPHATPLTRSLGLLGVLFLTLSVATPASSVFVIVPGMLHAAGSGTIWALVLAGIVCVATAFVYAELASVWPIAGGEYVMVARTLGPLAGFVMLGINVFNNLLFPPVLGLGVSAVLSTVIPGLPQVPVAVAVVALSTLIGLLNIRVNAVLTGVFLAIEMLALVVVAVLGFAHATQPIGALVLHPVMPLGATLHPASPAAIGLATSVAIFALNGYGAAVYFGEELHEAGRQIGRAVLVALVATLVLEIVPIVALLMGSRDLHAAFVDDDPFGTLVLARGGPLLSGWIAVGVVIAILNAAIACILSCARFFYSTGRDGAWGRPVDRWMQAIHPRFDSPWLATLFTGAVGIAACFAPLTLLLVLSGAGLIAIYAGIAVAAMVGRRTGATAHAPFRMPLYPAAPVLTLVALAYVVYTNWLDLDEGRPSLIATAAQIVGAALYYGLVLRRRGAWVVRDPAEPATG
ncbi:APC family permease [Sphingomonas sp. CROZ-RG-20F-R02-07]|uniref:APC family permease n=1 Tax=Sphingomonas sp. CROZ-RG-20F-R02-07 TaxID=2914832 RepID=UPI001F59DB02|nr:APC family permease [Sphingomonas sp. CROZ-RG-20F-R02-07]